MHFSSVTSNFLDNACTKIQNIAFKTSKMDQIALEYWYYGFLGRFRVDGRGFFHQKPILKNIRQNRNQYAAHAQKRVTVPLKCWFSWMRLWVVAYESSKTKSSWVIPKVVAVADESFSLQSLNRHSSTGLHRGGHNQSWSLTWSWVDVGKVKVKDTMDGFFVALSISSASCIPRLFICLDVLSLCVFLIVFQRFLLLPKVKINFVTCQLDLEVLISCE